MFFDVFFSFTVLHCFCRGAAEIRCSCWLQAHCFVELQLLVVSNNIPAGASDKACTPQWSQRSPESCGGWTGSPHRKIQQQKPIMALLAPVRCWWFVAQNIHKNDEIIWSCLLLLGLAVRDMRTLCGCQILIQYHDNTFRFIFLAYKLQLNVNLEMTPLCQVRKCWDEILGFCQVHGQDHLQEMMTEVLETSQRCLCVGFLDGWRQQT